MLTRSGGRRRYLLQCVEVFVMMNLPQSSHFVDVLHNNENSLRPSVSQLSYSYGARGVSRYRYAGTFTVSFMISLSYSKWGASAQTRTTCSWETSWTEATTALKPSFCYSRSRFVGPSSVSVFPLCTLSQVNKSGFVVAYRCVGFNRIHHPLWT